MKIRKSSKKDWQQVQALIREFPKHLMQHHLPRTSEFFVAIEVFAGASTDTCPIGQRPCRGRASAREAARLTIPGQLPYLAPFISPRETLPVLSLVRHRGCRL